MSEIGIVIVGSSFFLLCSSCRTNQSRQSQKRHLQKKWLGQPCQNEWGLRTVDEFLRSSVSNWSFWQKIGSQMSKIRKNWVAFAWKGTCPVMGVERGFSWLSSGENLEIFTSYHGKAHSFPIWNWLYVRDPELARGIQSQLMNECWLGLDSWGLEGKSSHWSRDPSLVLAVSSLDCWARNS